MISIREKIAELWKKEGQKEMINLTPEEQLSYNQSTTCHICRNEILSQKSLDEYDDYLEKMKEDKTLRWKRRSPENLGPKGKSKT